MNPEIITTKSGRTVTIWTGDCLASLRQMPDAGVQTCVTSPPYFGLRDYGVDGQIGLEPTPGAYVAKMVEVFAEVRRALRDDGTLWLNLGDSSAGSGKGGNPEDSPHDKQRTNRGTLVARPGDRMQCYGLKPKDLIGIPWRVAFALQADGWYLRSDIIWHKPNPMPESVTDRPTRAHEYLFLLAKSERYYYDHDAIKEDAVYSGITGMDDTGFKNAAEFDGKHGEAAKAGEQRRDKQRGHSRRHAGFNDRWDAMTKAEQCSGKRNKRDVWTVAPANYPDAHFATFPPKLIEPCIKAGCPAGGVVLDPFGGSFTTAEVALELGCDAVLCELNPKYVEMGKRRIQAEAAQGKLFT
ncbi:MAG: site-specific DNA-methyltransferase [Chloroflexi bacterium]|nr:site-specific DNA-methyltransferase [Chloroflexota bacterium]